MEIVELLYKISKRKIPLDADPYEKDISFDWNTKQRYENRGWGATNLQYVLGNYFKKVNRKYIPKNSEVKNIKNGVIHPFKGAY